MTPQTQANTRAAFLAAARLQSPSDRFIRQRIAEHMPGAPHAAEAAHVRMVASRYQVEIATVASVRGGAASMHARIVATPPLISRWACATALHEIGHVATRESCRPPRHRPTRSRFGKRLCVACEISAWRFARAHVYDLVWTAEHAANLADALGTYTPYATAAEAIEIDALRRARTR